MANSSYRDRSVIQKLDGVGREGLSCVRNLFHGSESG